MAVSREKVGERKGEIKLRCTPPITRPPTALVVHSWQCAIQVRSSLYSSPDFFGGDGEPRNGGAKARDQTHRRAVPVADLTRVA